MEEIIYYSELYDLYKNLLTNKQKEYFEEYYFKNLSFGEIAKNYNISRNAIYHQLKLTKELLEDYEEKIKLRSKLSLHNLRQKSNPYDALHLHSH